MASYFFESCSKLRVSTVKWLYVGKTYSKLCVFAKIVFFGIAGKNSRFCQNSLTYRDSVGDFKVFVSKWPQIRTTYLCRTQNTYGTLKRRYEVNLQEKINHNQNLSEFSQTKAINLKKVASFFQDAIHFHPGHLQPKTLIFTIRALVE